MRRGRPRGPPGRPARGGGGTLWPRRRPVPSRRLGVALSRRRLVPQRAAGRLASAQQQPSESKQINRARRGRAPDAPPCFCPATPLFLPPSLPHPKTPNASVRAYPRGSEAGEPRLYLVVVALAPPHTRASGHCCGRPLHPCRAAGSSVVPKRGARLAGARLACRPQRHARFTRGRSGPAGR